VKSAATLNRATHRGISEFFAPGLGGVSSGGGTSIDYEPISLEQAHSLIDSEQVHRIAIRPERNVDEFWLHLYEGPKPLDLDLSRRVAGRSLD
jgi:hypothetical protein